LNTSVLRKDGHCTGIEWDEEEKEEEEEEEEERLALLSWSTMRVHMESPSRGIS
jgi:CO dehydrogenase/acetyl-CoA synthase beta subunit